MDSKQITPAPDCTEYATDNRSLQQANLALLAALAERLTGERVEVLVTCHDGTRAWCAPNALLGVRWSSRGDDQK